MDAPSTPATRRAMWRHDSEQLIEALRRHDLLTDADKRRRRLEREAYLHGLRSVTETADGFVVETHRVSPERSCAATIPKAGGVSHQTFETLAWHKDQDVRGRPHHQDVEWFDPPERMPYGALLVDPIFALVMADADANEWTIRDLISNSDHFCTRKTSSIRLRGPGGVGKIAVKLNRNEVHVGFAIPGTEDATWSNGHLNATFDALPETIAVAARGRPLAALLDHDMIARVPDVTIASVTRIGSTNRYVIATSAARAEGMIPCPAKLDVAA